LYLLESWFLNCYSCVKLTVRFRCSLNLSLESDKGRYCRRCYSQFMSMIWPILVTLHVVFILCNADDILLLSPTVCELQNVLHMCERELDAL